MLRALKEDEEICSILINFESWARSLPHCFLVGVHFGHRSLDKMHNSFNVEQ